MPAEMSPTLSVGSIKLSSVVAIPPIRIPKCSHCECKDKSHEPGSRRGCKHQTHLEERPLVGKDDLGLDPDGDGYPLTGRSGHPSVLDAITLGQRLGFVITLAFLR